MKSLNDVTVGIKAFIRVDCLERTFDQLIDRGFKEIIIADDAPDDEKKNNIYKKYQNILPIKVLRLPFDTGLAEGRNEIVRQCKSEYLLMLDDDQGVRENIWKLREVIENDNLLGGVSCIWDEYGVKRCTATDLKVHGNYLIKEMSKNNKIHGSTNNRYQYFDFIPNSTLFRTKCLVEFPWDSFYKIGSEHIDFYLTHKLKSSWRFAVALDVTIDHFPETKNADYNQLRHGERKQRSLDYFLNKYSLIKVIEVSKLLGKSDKIFKFFRSIGLSVRAIEKIRKVI